jgi:hypothetical protein
MQEHASREDAIQRQLDLMNVPGPANVHKALIKAIIKRNDMILEMMRLGHDLGILNDMEVYTYIRTGTCLCIQTCLCVSLAVQ